MDYAKPERSAVKAWRLVRLLTLVVFFLLFIVSLMLAIIYGGITLIAVCGVLGALFLYKAIGCFIYPLIEYRQWKYMISDEKIEIIHGIFFIKRDIIPVIRIQNITVKQGPVYRRYGLYSVAIALASGTFEIVGLSFDTAEGIAEKMREKLYARLQEKGEA